MKRIFAVCAAAGMVMLVGCVSIDSTRKQLASSNPEEVREAERNIVSIAATGVHASGLRFAPFDENQRIEFVNLAPDNDLLIKIIEETQGRPDVSEAKVIAAAVSKIDYSKSGIGMEILMHHRNVIYIVMEVEKVYPHLKEGDGIENRIIATLGEKELREAIYARIGLPDSTLVKLHEKFVPLTKDQGILWEIADGEYMRDVKSSADCISVRRMAINRITDQEILTEIATNLKEEEELRQLAVARITSPDFLIKVALACEKSVVTRLVVTRLLEMKSGCAIARLVTEKPFDCFALTDFGKIKEYEIESKSNGLQKDFSIEKANAIIAFISADEDLALVAQKSRSFRMRELAIQKLNDQRALAAIVSSVEDCPYDIEQKEKHWLDNGYEWMTHTQAASEEKLKKIAVASMTDGALLRNIRKETKSDTIKRCISSRLAELGDSDVEEIVASEKYGEDIFFMLAALKEPKELEKVAMEAKLKGVRILAASRLGGDTFASVAKKELTSGSTAKPISGKTQIGGYYLGMNIEDMFAKVEVENPEVSPTLCLNGGALCLVGGNTRDIAIADTGTRSVSWISLPASVVKRIVGFTVGSYDDLEKAIEKKLGVSFGYDVISKGNVSQKIGNLENTEGETLRYFVGEIVEGEDMRRTFRKSYNNSSAGFGSLSALGASLENALEDAQQESENKANARNRMFQLPGSLQLLPTKNAVRGSLNSMGSFSKSGLLGDALNAASKLRDGVKGVQDLQKSMDSLKSAADALKSGSLGDALSEGVKGVQDLQKSMDSLKSAADALKNLSL